MFTNEIVYQNPAHWPDDVLAIFDRAITVEYATLTSRNSPVTYPVTPYTGEDGLTLDVSTGLTYPSKTERARRNPKVALLYSDPVGSGLPRPPVVLVHGLATVRDANLQGNTDRYIRLSMQKLPAAYEDAPRFFLQRMGWYFARIWIQITPIRIFWWPEGQLHRPPQVWQAPIGTEASPSDPAPAGKAQPAWLEEPGEWQRSAAYAIENLGNPVLTVVGPNGFPVPFRMGQARLTANGIRLAVPAGLPVAAAGPACLTFHTHTESFTSQENLVFVGEAQQEEQECVFVMNRQLGNMSSARSRLKATISLLNNGRKLTPRMRLEAQRRGQPTPAVHLPARI